ncbi:UPF0481 protein At3g47200 isoform X1 [Brachypodium distachyon]|uniref:Uncharacterized protein n=2 Tax=Brachypodium distachyon TaxID=15368 RepID=A0A0Q3INR7_BRADI|nr:UPF0481 protein At3g47200 isoform X1 [Brachypodium distachyon]KQK07491.1 hypothetical protein BRADI_2g35750v3 [Brachypodium distachyon]|eukprot:XP_003568927.1 UPF0481 protein At3g47200 isoform X1 [Brachypodium distachyon]
MAEAEDVMSVIEIEELGISMKNELRNCFSSDIVYDSGSQFCLIPRIHEHIRASDRYSYEPIILSIGPYHHGSPALSSTEREKWNRLDYVLKLNCEKGLKDYLTVINGLEKRARMCYSGDIKMNKKDFLQTLLLDGCFVLVSLGKFNEFIRPELHTGMPSSSHAEILKEDSSSGHPEVTGVNDIQQINTKTSNAMKSTVVGEDIVNHTHSREENSVLEIELCSQSSGHNTGQCLYPDNAQQIGQWYDVYVIHNLFLLENQIPFFIVEAVYEVAISNKVAPTTTCKSSFARYTERYVSFYPTAVRESSRPKDFDHLLHLCHMYFRPSSNQDEHHTTKHYIRYFLQMGRDYLSHLGSSQHDHFPNRWRRETQYHEAGIEFKMRTYSEHNPHSLLDIKLRDGILEIPFLFVDEETIVFFRNLIALEQTCPQVGNYVTAYTVFMSKLLSMPDDVALLARKGVIARHMRTDRDISQLFTRLTKGVVFDFYGNHHLKHLCLALEVSYQNRMHRWVAWLRHNHLSNPWLVVAALAGVIVLFCTVAQTVLTVQSYVNPR